MPSTRSDSSTETRDLRAIKNPLREALPRLRETCAVERLVLHGSRVREEAEVKSDLDILVDFGDSEAGRRVSLLDVIALKQELEPPLDVPIDLGERTALQGPVGEKIRDLLRKMQDEES